MGGFEALDPSQATLDWLRGKTRREMLPEKSQQQEWFLGIYKEASIFKEQQKLNQPKR